MYRYMYVNHLFTRFFLIVSLSAIPAVGAGQNSGHSAAEQECVILLHGLARTSGSMNKMANALADAGFVSVNVDYPSRKKPVEELAPEAISRGLERCALAGTGAIHFVTHSLGGILVRYYLNHRRPKKLGRVVMLSPPNRGSEVADSLKDTVFYQWLNGPTGQQLITGPEGLPEKMGPVSFPVGIITGNRHSFFDGWLAKIIPGQDDGKVAVERAKVAGMSDFLVLPYSHPFIMNQEEVIVQSLYFLHHGHFRRGDDPRTDQ